MKVTSTREMREMDRRAIEEFGITQELLMENAGLATFSIILNEIGVQGNRFLLLCGVGNNGGDGLVVARKLHSMNADVRVLIAGDSARFKGAAKQNFEILSRLPVRVGNIDSLQALTEEITCCDVLIDALFGTGLTREVEGIYRDVIDAMNRSGKTILSIDIPSGINGNSGGIMGSAVKADYTVTFGTPKLGNLLYPGFSHCGRLYVSHISFPLSVSQNDSIQVEVSIPPSLPGRNPDGHKGDFGDVLFLAGAASYYGAPLYSALSFLKSGGGYARLAAPRSITPFIASRGSEIVFAPQEETVQGSISLSSLESLLRLAEKVDMVVAGPGLSLNQETQELVRQFAVSVQKPLILDGDGITALSSSIDIIENRSHPTILTPHLGEMSRITGISIAEIRKKRVENLREICGKLSSHIVLKGAHTLIGYPDGRVFINLSGNSGMATAGSGDTLTGAIAALFGLGLEIGDALRAGVFLHGLSGDLAALHRGEDGITAQDLLDFLPLAVKEFREKREDILRNFYGKIYLV